MTSELRYSNLAIGMIVGTIHGKKFKICWRHLSKQEFFLQVKKSADQMHLKVCN